MSRPLLEVCVETLEQAVVAVEAGAERIELSSRLDLDGLTPVPGLTKSVVDAVDVPVIAMVRPREGEFTCRPGEMSRMKVDLDRVLQEGASGFVFGLVDGSGVDMINCQLLIAAAGDVESVFHRAFDGIIDQATATDDLVELGVDRVLTSGGPPTALEGVDTLRRLVEYANGRIEFMPGGGVRSGNIATIAHETKCPCIHGSFGATSGAIDTNDLRAAVAALTKGA